MLMTGTSPVFYPDEPAPLVAAPELPKVEEPIVLPEAEEPKVEDKKVEEPKVEAKAEEPKAEDKKVEEPAAVVPETYTLTAGEGVELDAKLVEQATPLFKELGFTNETAQKVVDFYASTVLPEVAQGVQGDTLRLLGLDGMATWAKDARADKEIGGADFEKNLTLAAAARDKLGSPALTALLETSRIGNHPEMLRFFVKAGKAIGEGTVHTPATGAQNVDGATAFYGEAFAPKA